MPGSGATRPCPGVDVGAEQARQRAFAVAAGVIALSIVGFLLALAFQWPSDFVLGEEPDTKVTLADLATGTVTSIPLPPLVVLVLATMLVRSTRWWGTAALVVLALLGLVFTVGGIGEVTSSNPHVSEAVLVTAGTVYVLVGLAMTATSLLALARGRRAPSG